MNTAVAEDLREWETTTDQVYVRIPYVHGGETLRRVVGWARRRGDRLWEVRIPPNAHVELAGSLVDAKKRLAELTRAQGRKLWH